MNVFIPHTFQNYPGSVTSISEPAVKDNNGIEIPSGWIAVHPLHRNTQGSRYVTCSKFCRGSAIHQIKVPRFVLQSLGESFVSSIRIGRYFCLLGEQVGGEKMEKKVKKQSLQIY